MKEIAAKQLLGMPVYSISEGASIGVVKSIIIDPEAKQLLAFSVDRKGWYRDIKIIAFSKIKTIGHDAITITEKSNAARAANLPKMIQYLHEPNHLTGNRVISDDGRTLGRVEEYYLDRETGAISRLDIACGAKGNLLSGKCCLQGKYIRTIGEAAIVVDKNCFATLETMDSTLKTNLQEMKEKANEAWQLTKDTSKKWGQSLSQKWNDTKETWEEAKAAKRQAQQEAESDMPATELPEIEESTAAKPAEPIQTPPETPTTESETTASAQPETTVGEEATANITPPLQEQTTIEKAEEKLAQ